MVLLISYDLNGHERPAAYAAVRGVIERHAIDWRKPLYSQWLVETNDSCQTWTNRLLQVMDPNDYLFVCRVPPKPYHWGWLEKEIWEWLDVKV